MQKMSTEKPKTKRYKGFVAVHIGAGYHSPANSELYKQVCKQACIQAVKLLREKKSALEAVSAAVVALEDSQWTNAGLGSNLSLSGTVECDASIMDGKTSHYGAVGALSGVKNPILVAESLLRTQMQGELSLGRIPPSTVVAHGAYDWAIKHGIPSIPQHELITDSSRKTYLKNKRKLEMFDEGYNAKYRRLDVVDGVKCQTVQKNGCCEDEMVNDNVDGTQMNVPTCSNIVRTDGSSDDPDEDHSAVDEDVRMDTVGAICVDDDGCIASAVSSGGIILKQPGRLGQAALYGCGCWAENDTTGAAVGVSTSGCGEQLSKTIFARTCAESLKNQDDRTQALHKCVMTKFIESPYMRHEKQPLGGAVVVTVDSRTGIGERERDAKKGGDIVATDRLAIEVLWAHTTDSMCLSYMSTQDNHAKAIVSRLPAGSRAGKSVVVQSKSYTVTGSAGRDDK